MKHNGCIFSEQLSLKSCKINGKEYQVGESFMVNNCAESCTCLGHDGFGCLSLFPPGLVICRQGQQMFL